MQRTRHARTKRMPSPRRRCTTKQSQSPPTPLRPRRPIPHTPSTTHRHHQRLTKLTESRQQCPRPNQLPTRLPNHHRRRPRHARRTPHPSTGNRRTVRRINYRPLDTLQPHPENAKTHDIGVIIESIKRFGSVDPIVIDGRTDLIMSGHGRSEALAWLKKDGDTPPDGIRVDDNGDWLIPVVDGWSSRTDYDAHAAMIALNRTTELGGWDQTALVDLLEQLAEYDDGLDGVGYDGDDLDTLKAQLAYLDEPDNESELDSDESERIGLALL